MMSILIHTITVLAAVALLIYIIDYTKYVLNCYNTKRAPVPSNYKCFKCHRKGNHWIMDCTYLDMCLGFINSYNHHIHQIQASNKCNPPIKCNPLQINKHPNDQVISINANHNEINDSTFSEIHINKSQQIYSSQKMDMKFDKLLSGYDNMNIPNSPSSTTSDTYSIKSDITTYSDEFELKSKTEQDEMKAIMLEDNQKDASLCAWKSTQLEDNSVMQFMDQVFNDIQSTIVNVETLNDASNKLYTSDISDDNFIYEDKSSNELSDSDTDMQYTITDYSMEVMLNCLHKLKQTRLILHNENETSLSNLVKEIQQIEKNIETRLAIQ
eukprot:102663_1